MKFSIQFFYKLWPVDNGKFEIEAKDKLDAYNTVHEMIAANDDRISCIENWDTYEPTPVISV